MFVITFSASNDISAQNKNTALKRRHPIKTINYESGLLNNETTNIITDISGFTWVSTKTGLQRFNGYTLETILPVVNNDTFNINYPVYFFGLKDGSIWISFKEGVLEFSPVSNTFTLVISLHSTQNSFFNVVPLKETVDGVWCMHEQKGIVIYNRKGAITEQLENFEFETIADIIKSHQINYSNSIASNRQYIFINNAANKKILKIDTREKKFGYVNFEEKNIFDIACTEDKLYVFSKEEILCINISDDRIITRVNLKTVVNENAAGGSLRLYNNNHLLVSINRHLYEFDTNCVYHFELTDLNRNPLLSTGYIIQTYTDKFKRIWLLTNNDIKRIENIEIPFAHFIYPNEKNNFVRSLYYDEQKQVLIAGCFNGGIQLYDLLANPLWDKPLVTADVKDIIAIEKLTDDEYLVITYGRGWYLLNPFSKKLKSLNIPPAIEAKLQSRHVSFGNNIQRINANTLFISTAENVFRCVFSGTLLLSADSLLPFKSNSINAINCFTYDDNQTLWAATISGVIYDLDKNKVLQTIHVPENYPVRSITGDIKKNIWIGTDKGLFVYTQAGQMKKRITRETGLLNDCIYALLPADDNAAVFASSNLGLSSVLVDGTVKNYSKEIGLQENEFNTGSALKTPDRKFYFGGVNGITAFYPASLSVTIDTPVLHITRLVISDSLYNSSAGTWEGDSILLNYKQNRLRFNLAAMGLLNANEYIYQYRMRQLEEQWQTSYLPIDINYTLQPGSYILEIKCHPVLSANATFYKRFFIIIRAPWWQTLWFRIVAFILAVAVVAFIIQQYNYRKYRQKIAALQMQQQIQRERERISRDLHDNLGAYATAIIAGAEMIENKTPGYESTLSHLKTNAAELMSHLRDTIWASNKERILLTAISDRFKNYIQKISLSYPNTNVEIKEVITNNISFSPVQALNIFRILQEAFTNAIKHSGANAINIFFNSNDDLYICLSDNGTGINGIDYKKNGNGIKNMESRASESGLHLSIKNDKTTGTAIVITSQPLLQIKY